MNWFLCLKVSQLRDYSTNGGGGGGGQAFDLSSCANVKIVETSEGVIRSPFYFKTPTTDGSGNRTTSFKCKWTLIAPADQAFEIT